MLHVGQEVDVRVVGVDRENKKIALSLKQVEENPWNRIEQKYHVGDTVPAKITKLAQFGAFAELEPGVEGLVHISELSDERITHPKQVVREGEDVSLRIIKIDPSRHRLGLSLRQAEEAGDYDSAEAMKPGPAATSYSFSDSSSTSEDDYGAPAATTPAKVEEPPEAVHVLASDQGESEAGERPPTAPRAFPNTDLGRGS